MCTEVSGRPLAPGGWLHGYAASNAMLPGSSEQHSLRRSESRLHQERRNNIGFEPTLFVACRPQDKALSVEDMKHVIAEGWAKQP